MRRARLIEISVVVCIITFLLFVVGDGRDRAEEIERLIDRTPIAEANADERRASTLCSEFSCHGTWTALNGLAQIEFVVGRDSGGCEDIVWRIMKQDRVFVELRRSISHQDGVLRLDRPVADLQLRVLDRFYVICEGEAKYIVPAVDIREYEETLRGMKPLYGLILAQDK